MPYNLNSLDPNFENDFATVLSSKREDQADVTAAVADIIADVIRRGDDAVMELTAKFDHVEAKSMDDLSLSSDDLKAAYDRIDQDLRDALHLAADRIAAFHEKQFPQDLHYKDDAGVGLGLRHTPVDAAGLYVPGGQGGLSVISFNECDAGKSGRCRAASDGGANAPR